MTEQLSRVRAHTRTHACTHAYAHPTPHLTAAFQQAPEEAGVGESLPHPDPMAHEAALEARVGRAMPCSLLHPQHPAWAWHIAAARQIVAVRLLTAWGHCAPSPHLALPNHSVSTSTLFGWSAGGRTQFPEMATHSSILTWRIPRTEEPGRLQSTGSQESDMTEQLGTHSVLKEGFS